MRIFDSFVIDPHWSVSADAIRAWWTSADRIDGIGFIERFGPVLGVTALLVLIFGIGEREPIRKWLVAYIGCIAVIAIWSNLYFAPVESSLPMVVDSLSDDDLRALIDEWIRWKLVRLAIGLLALACVTRALSLAHFR